MSWDKLHRLAATLATAMINRTQILPLILVATWKGINQPAKVDFALLLTLHLRESRRGNTV
jgi:hypothetical protein